MLVEVGTWIAIWWPAVSGIWVTFCSVSWDHFGCQHKILNVMQAHNKFTLKYIDLWNWFAEAQKCVTFCDVNQLIFIIGVNRALCRTPSQSYGVSLAIWDHTALPATRRKWTPPALTPARQAGTQFTYPGGMEGWVDLGDLLHTEMVYQATEGHPSKY